MKHNSIRWRVWVDIRHHSADFAWWILRILLGAYLIVWVDTPYRSPERWTGFWAQIPKWWNTIEPVVEKEMANLWGNSPKQKKMGIEKFGGEIVNFITSETNILVATWRHSIVYIGNPVLRLDKKTGQRAWDRRIGEHGHWEREWEWKREQTQTLSIGEEGTGHLPQSR